MQIFQNIKSARSKKLSPWQNAFLDFITDVIVIFLLVLLIIKPFFFAPFRVQQQSMTPNVLDGEFIIVWKTPYVFGAEYERNDIVVFKIENSENYLIKRIIGLPGEKIRLYEGYTWIENELGKFEKLNESFLASNNLGNTCIRNSFCSDTEKAKSIEFEIPENKYFVMGDNRLASRDSRICFKSSCNSADATNFLDKKEIEGKALISIARFWKENGKKNLTLKNMRILGK
jgi:signal peptidase I